MTKKSLWENVAGLGRAARGKDEGHLVVAGKVTLRRRMGRWLFPLPFRGGILLALLTLYDPTSMSSSVFTSTPSSIAGSDDESDGKHDHHESHSR
jgi:hypothetical protein